MQPWRAIPEFSAFNYNPTAAWTLSLFAGGHADSSRVRRHFGTYRPRVLDLDLSVAAEDFPYRPLLSSDDLKLCSGRGLGSQWGDVVVLTWTLRLRRVILRRDVVV